MLNFLGILFHARIPWNQSLDRYGPSSLLSLVMSGACFGLATTVRSNGIFSGLIYIHHVSALFYSRINLRTILTATVIGISAMLILSGMLIPQYMAYQEFCNVTSDVDIRPWCSRTLPSIYTWVQEHYWYDITGPVPSSIRLTLLRNVGFLRYWTISNLPLFLLALPMLLILVVTGLIAPSLISKSETPGTERSVAYVRCLALPQIVLALLAFTTFHVQIVNRIATGYPLWYIVLAAAILPQKRSNQFSKPDDQKKGGTLIEQARGYLGKSSTQQLIFKGMFMYSIIQGGLYASFMPPA